MIHTLTHEGSARWTQIRRRFRLLLAGTISALLMALTTIGTAAAQGGGGGGTSTIGAKIEAFATALQQLGRPIGLLSFTIIALAFAIAPAARQWASENKGMTGGVIFGLLMLTFIADIVAFIMGT